MTQRVRALAPDGVDLALDVAGSGVLDLATRRHNRSCYQATCAAVVATQRGLLRRDRADVNEIEHPEPGEVGSLSGDSPEGGSVLGGL